MSLYRWRARLCAMKTVGERVKEAAKAVGGLNALAKIVGMPRRTLGDQISGKFEVKLSFIVDVARATGVTVNWLATGEGKMFADPARSAGKSFDAALLEKCARVVTAVHREANIKLPPEKVSVEAAELYNELMERLADPSDQEEIEAALPQLRHLLRKRLAAAAAEPGSGKHSAS
ncbi:helix-turn-helix transcriptional regulator [Stappia sp. F7233]|uniref:Helix-turn-helix transcriptional regulator n=1 Tax=Stappia albiluteola TaxID=2758565 RepID=A0A839AAT1_9HYPH|nr:helix-turn-helix transcriptional regulator [Stappia albiluteola]MBA5776134.1 helix-turn-helix transcriptional regulator [Stappia albiluteola]